MAGTLLAGTTASAGAATLSPTSANFGNQAPGTVSAPKAFTLTPAPLDILSLTIATSGDFKQTNTCAAVLQTAPCTVNVTFNPTAAGVRSGTLSTTTLVLGGPTAALTGTGDPSAGNPGSGSGAGNKQCAKKGKKGKKGKGKKRAAASKKKKGKSGKKCKKGKRKKGKKNKK